MSELNPKSHTQPGDLALLISAQNKRFIILLDPDARLETHRGVLHHHDLIGLAWGSRVKSHLGSPFVILQPSLSDLLLETRRNTQIMYPKDIGYILVTMGIGPGQHVIEAGSGSGAFTTALAHAVGPQGRVTSYEVRPEMLRLAEKNLERLGMADRVTFKLHDISAGFDEADVDALFLDVPSPEDYISQSRLALKSGGQFGSILPTTNQVSRLLIALKREQFAFIDVCETMLRFYKAVPDRLRPTDRMVAHTGFLIFARAVTPWDNLGEETNAEPFDVGHEPAEPDSPIPDPA
ncbi:MAG: tRNA (adenine-N1)-methyltransferase [Anaerolineales bacterium]|nr:tRNA (adenine-N1)-methyltransferase [Anaerolineales bacterium]